MADNGNSFGALQEWSREQVVSQIEFWRRTFVTATKGGSGWKKGEDVRVIVIGGIKYIRTDNNRTPADNLGNLPEF
jgi:hypothetical protein